MYALLMKLSFIDPFISFLTAYFLDEFFLMSQGYWYKSGFEALHKFSQSFPKEKYGFKALYTHVYDHIDRVRVYQQVKIQM